jgi:hypothetical protein
MTGCETPAMLTGTGMDSGLCQKGLAGTGTVAAGAAATGDINRQTASE